jgi:hypothetical protein
MRNFTKHIKTEQGLVTFSFNRVYTVEGTKYFVSTRNKTFISRFFQMENKSGVWAFRDVSEVPEWVMPLESKLADIIGQFHPGETR